MRAQFTTGHEVADVDLVLEAGVEGGEQAVEILLLGAAVRPHLRGGAGVKRVMIVLVAWYVEQLVRAYILAFEHFRAKREGTDREDKAAGKEAAGSEP